MANAEGWVALAALPHLGMGLAMFYARLRLEPQSRRGLRYAVTDRRILIVRLGRKVRVSSLAIDRIPAMRFTEIDYDIGPIRFFKRPVFWGRHPLRIMASLDPEPQFLAIRQALNVIELIEGLGGRRR